MRPLWWHRYGVWILTLIAVATVTFLPAYRALNGPVPVGRQLPAAAAGANGAGR